MLHFVGFGCGSCFIFNSAQIEQITENVASWKNAIDVAFEENAQIVIEKFGMTTVQLQFLSLVELDRFRWRVAFDCVNYLSEKFELFREKF